MYMDCTLCFLGFCSQSLVTHPSLLLISMCEFKSHMVLKLGKKAIYMHKLNSLWPNTFQEAEQEGSLRQMQVSRVSIGLLGLISGV